MLLILVTWFALSFQSFAANETIDPDILFTVPRPQTLYSKPGWDFARFIKTYPAGKPIPSSAPGRAWITPGMELRALRIQEFHGVQYVEVQEAGNSDRKGWMRWDYLYYFDRTSNAIKQCPEEIIKKLKDNAMAVLSKVIPPSPPTPPPASQAAPKSPPKDTQEYRSPPLSPAFSSRGADCTAYIKPDGTFGRKGQLAIKEILGTGRSSNRWGYFKSNKIDGMDDICPNFNNLNDSEKANFWVWMLAALAWDEGSCRENVVRHDATNGIAAGELQVPEDWEDGRSWRGKGCESSTGPVQGVNAKGKLTGGSYHMASSTNYIPCAVEILGGSLCGFYSSRRYPLRCDYTKDFDSKGLTGKHLYWEKLRHPQSGHVINLIKQFPLCKRGA